ncbi:hypothetical protein RF11_15403 [Thelohanellus kitauei]|uniref:Uncharacterized protein n=1 Tax=Thelohanellus kitauei TaxID=669202 RepID=A0A0C2MHQ3_THEKT|nr:hypothetical protein RF11_15403 [Thelohanellus kitauei]
MCKVTELELSYDRQVFDNELILLNEFYCFKIKQIIRKVTATSVSKYKRAGIQQLPEYFYFCLYHKDSKTLLRIPFYGEEGMFEAADFGLFPKNITVKQPKFHDQEIIQNFTSLMFLHLISWSPFSRHDNGSIKYILYENMVINNGDFIKINNDDHIYQICEIFKLQAIETVLTDYELKLRQYFPYDKMKIFPNILYYKKEYIQTDVYKTILTKDIASICCILSEFEYLNSISHITKCVIHISMKMMFMFAVGSFWSLK